jgi:galactoside O-acetyltransferase
MDKFLLTLFQKARQLFKPQSNQNDKSFNADKTTFLLSGTKIRFDAGKEDREYVNIGKSGIIKAEFIFESPKGFIKIGDNVHIGQATVICRNTIIIGNDVTMAWGITIYDHNSHSIYWEYRQNDNKISYDDFQKFNGKSVISKNWDHVLDKPITIEDKVWIGFDVTILKGVTIGEGAVIGAKSVVTKSVPPWTVAAGNPAKVMKTIETK